MYLNKLFLELIDGKTLSLLHDGEFGLLAVRHLVPSEGVSFPRWKVERHRADAPQVGSDLPSFICGRRGTGLMLGSGKILLFSLIKMNCNDNLMS